MLPNATKKAAALNKVTILIFAHSLGKVPL
jgi:hypothetical protein